MQAGSRRDGRNYEILNKYKTLHFLVVFSFDSFKNIIRILKRGDVVEKSFVS